MSQIHAASQRASTGRVEAPNGTRQPAVPVKKSMTPIYLVCLEDGKRFSLAEAWSAHAVQHDAEQYRNKRSLPADYPMRRARLCGGTFATAKKIGLGQQRRRRK